MIPYTAHASAQDSEGSFGATVGAHPFRDSFDQLRADGACSLRRHVALGDPGSSSRNHELSLLGHADERPLDGSLFVEHDLLMHNVKTVLPQQLSRRRTRQVWALTPGGGITDGKY